MRWRRSESCDVMHGRRDVVLGPHASFVWICWVGGLRARQENALFRDTQPKRIARGCEDQNRTDTHSRIAETQPHRHTHTQTHSDATENPSRTEEEEKMQKLTLTSSLGRSRCGWGLGCCLRSSSRGGCSCSSRSRCCISVITSGPCGGLSSEKVGVGG